MSEKENVNNNLENLEKENDSLKNQIEILKEKESSYKESFAKIKKIQNEYESSYNESLKEGKKREEEIKKKYLEYQNILEMQNEENEKRFNEEILLFKNELKEKDTIINSLNEKIIELTEKVSKNELKFHFKEKEYEEIILAKERKLKELNDAIKQIVQEAGEEIKRLSQQLEEFQNRVRINNPYTANLLIERDNDKDRINNLNKSVDNIKNNINSIKSLKQNDIIRQSQNIINNSVLLSDNFKNILLDGNSPQNMNNSYMITHNRLYNDIPQFYTQNNFYNREKNNQDLKTQLYILQNDKNMLFNQLKQKEKEVNFWKNIRRDLYDNAQRHGVRSGGTNYNSNKIINDIKIKNMEKTLANYGSKINKIKKQYNESLLNQQREIEKLKNDMENSINLTQHSKYNEGTLNNNSYENIGDGDDNGQGQRSSEDLLHALKITIPSKEGIRNEYINSQLQKIKNSESSDNQEDSKE